MAARGCHTHGVPIPKPVASLNKVATNRVMRPLATRAPGFALIHHVGRRSGRRYTTPVNAFVTDDGFVIALTYGPDVDWWRNILAAGGCAVTHRRRRIDLVNPHRIRTEEGMAAMPVVVRSILRLIGVTEFVTLDRPG